VPNGKSFSNYEKEIVAEQYRTNQKNKPNKKVGEKTK
jgi:hypothetical protein